MKIMKIMMLVSPIYFIKLNLKENVISNRKIVLNKIFMEKITKK